MGIIQTESQEGGREEGQKGEGSLKVEGKQKGMKVRRADDRQNMFKEQTELSRKKNGRKTEYSPKFRKQVRYIMKAEERQKMPKIIRKA